MSQFPQFIEIQTTTICNANCIICPYKGAAEKFGSELMPDWLLNKILHECDGYSSDIERIIPYLNNEPSLDKRFIDILRRVKQAGHFIEVSTNFSGMTESKIKAIVDEKLVDDLRISFFGGDESTYEMLMPDLNFNNTVKKIETFLSYDLLNTIPASIILVLLPNLDIEEHSDKIRQLFGNVKIHFYGFLDRAGNVKGFANEKILAPNQWSSSYKLAGCKLNRPFERCCILANGDVIICSQDWDREEIIGNVKNESISDIWNGEKFNEIRNKVLGTIGVPEGFICNKCKLAFILEEGSATKRMNFLGDRYMTDKDEKLL